MKAEIPIWVKTVDPIPNEESLDTIKKLLRKKLKKAEFDRFLSRWLGRNVEVEVGDPMWEESDDEVEETVENPVESIARMITDDPDVFNEDENGNVVPCTVCKGTGKQNLQVKDYSSTGMKPQKPIEISCVWCNGTGQSTPSQEQELETYKNMWCKCGASEEAGTVFHDDGQCDGMGGTIVNKHHYHCAECGKIVQIG